MKKSKRNVIIVSVLLMFLGVGISFLGLALANFDMNVFNTEKFEPKIYYIEEKFSDIDILTDTCDIKFLPSEDNRAKVVYFDSENVFYNVGVKENVLNIERVDEREWYEHIGFYWQETDIKVYLPENEYGNLNIKSSTGDIELPKLMSFYSVGIETSTGEVNINSRVKDEININGSTGDVELNGVSVQSLNIRLSTGDISISDTDVNGNIELKATSGEVEFDTVNCRNIKAQTDTGEMEYENLRTSGSISFKTTTGDVTLINSDGAALDIVTDTGDVYGTLLSEKIFVTESSTGRIKVPQSLSGGKCQVKTDTGNITFKVN